MAPHALCGVRSHTPIGGISALEVRQLADDAIVRAMARSLYLVALAPLLAGCPDDDAAVFIEPTILAPSATVAAQTLGTSLTGAFELRLHLGPRASGASEVALGAFAIQSSDQQTTIVSPLEVVPDRSMPVT